MGKFRTSFAEDIFNQKYRHEGALTWSELSKLVVEDVCKDHLTKDEKDQLAQFIDEFKFIPGGRYLYYAGRKKKFFNNCYLLSALDDTREDWAELSKKAELCLTTGGGIGGCYSIYRPKGSPLHGTGGIASGPLPKMEIINSIGRGVMQGGGRRSAIYASLRWNHGDVNDFLHMKDWHIKKIPGTDITYSDAKNADFNFQCPMDYTNISVDYHTDWLMNYWKTGDIGDVFFENAKQACSTAEPGFSFNFFDKETEVLRNACTEITSSDDSDVCNLGSINIAACKDIFELKDVVELAIKFLICGTLYAELPYDKVYEIREKNRRLGLGLMGLHEWLVQRRYKYEVPGELKRWLRVYKSVSNNVAYNFSRSLSISRPVASRAIAPTGTIGILAGTTTGIEPIFAVAYKRRYFKSGRWHYQYVIDAAAQALIDYYGIDPEKLESSLDLAKDYERRIKFQAEVQEFVDHGISSTINLPAWGSEYNNDDTVRDFANCLASHAHRLRGFTCYPDGARGGQPLTSVPYKEAKEQVGKVFEEMVDVCDITGRGGSCGV